MEIPDQMGVNLNGSCPILNGWKRKTDPENLLLKQLLSDLLESRLELLFVFFYQEEGKVSLQKEF